MFDFAWSEILLIGAVALIAIGPKDMPAAIRTVTSMIKKARRMAAEFQTHVDEMVREAELGDVKKAFNEIRNLDISSTIERAIDPDRSLRKTFEEDPFKPTYPAPADVAPFSQPDAGAQLATAELEPSPEPVAAAAPDPPRIEAPAYIPPQLVPAAPPSDPAAPPEEAPAWIPPSIVLQRRRKT